MSFHKSLLPLLLTATFLHAADVPDAPAPDAASILQILKKLKEDQLSQQKARLEKALRDAQAAAASPSAAATAWEEAIRETQFEGQPKEGAAFRAWKDKDGDAMRDKEVVSAAHLYFRWLVLTLQHGNGRTTKDLLPDVIAYTRDLAVDQAAVETLMENFKREEELFKTGKHGNRPVRPHTDQQTRQLHDQLLRGLGGSAPVKAMQIDGLIESLAPSPKRGPKGAIIPDSDETKQTWTSSCGDLDGIYQTIILPELRAARDSRALEYWDLRIKRAADAASRTKLAYDAEKFTNEIRPSLLWERADEYANLGQRNRSINEKLTVLKTYPRHPDAAKWIDQLLGQLAPAVAPPLPAATPGSASSAVPNSSLPGAGPSEAPGVAPAPAAR